MGKLVGRPTAVGGRNVGGAVDVEFACQTLLDEGGGRIEYWGV